MNNDNVPNGPMIPGGGIPLLGGKKTFPASCEMVDKAGKISRVQLHLDGRITGDLQGWLDSAEQFQGDMGPLAPVMWMLCMAIRERLNEQAAKEEKPDAKDTRPEGD